MQKENCFVTKLEMVARKVGVPLKMTGVSSMPYPWIDGDDNLYQIQELCKISSYYGYIFIPITIGLSVMR